MYIFWWDYGKIREIVKSEKADLHSLIYALQYFKEVLKQALRIKHNQSAFNLEFLNNQ